MRVLALLSIQVILCQLIWNIVFKNSVIASPTLTQDEPITAAGHPFLYEPLRVTFENRKKFKAFSKIAYQLIHLWYPYIVETLGLPSEHLLEPVHIPIFYPEIIKSSDQLDSESDYATYSYGVINFSSYQLREVGVQSTDMKGVLIHELTHAISKIEAWCPPWINEGVADWFRLYHFQRKPLKRPEYKEDGYLDSYERAAYFLEWIRQRKNIPNLIPRLVEACRKLHPSRKAYVEDTFWVDILENGPADLWADMYADQETLRLEDWNTPAYNLADSKWSNTMVGIRMKWDARTVRTAPLVPRIKVEPTPDLKRFAKILKRHLKLNLPKIASKLSFPRRPTSRITVNFDLNNCTGEMFEYYSIDEDTPTPQLQLCAKFFEGQSKEYNKSFYLLTIFETVGAMMLRKLSCGCPQEVDWVVEGLASWVAYFHVSHHSPVSMSSLNEIRELKPRFDLSHIKTNKRLYFTAYFIQWVIETYDVPELPLKIAEALFQDGCPYDDKIWEDLTKWSLDHVFNNMMY